MSMKKTFTLLACLLASVFSQCPTFYADYNQRGNSFQLCSSDNLPANWNDQVSSFVVPAGYTIRLHKDAGFTGEFYGLYEKGSYNVPASFNDKLSSVSVFRTQRSKPRCPTFYADVDLQGESFQLCSSSSRLPNQWNDRVSSFIVPAGFSIELYVNNNKGGRSRGPYVEGLYNVPSSFNDQVSSIVVNDYKDNDSDNDNSPDVRCPVFYADTNQRGASFQLCKSDNVPKGWNDRVSSFVVPAGYSLQLFPDYDYQGDQWGPYTEGVYDIPKSFNDQLSSVSISRSSDRNSNSDNDYNNDNDRNRNHDRDHDDNDWRSDNDRNGNNNNQDRNRNDDRNNNQNPNWRDRRPDNNQNRYNNNDNDNQGRNRRRN